MRSKFGCLMGLIMIMFLCLSVVWIISQAFFLSPKNAHRFYSKRYENKKEIQKIIGVEIPKFKVTDSHFVYPPNFREEYEIQCTIEFSTLPDNNFFSELDNICVLPILQNYDKNSSFFYRNIDSIIERCWSKSEEEYRYIRYLDFEGRFLQSTNAYFYFILTKGSKTAKIIHGSN